MCGIAGCVHLGPAAPDHRPREIVERMLPALRHRGPDGEGYLEASWRRRTAVALAGPETPPAARLSRLPYAPAHDMAGPGVPDADLALGHRRLAILDLGPAGHQPMCNEDGSVWLAYNGEIFNFVELRSELAGSGHRFASNTDSEVLVHGYEQWGMEVLSRLNGMWAAVIWDMQAARLLLARDRFGMKPLYYSRCGDLLLVASEIKALMASGIVGRAPNDRAVTDFLAHSVQDQAADTFYRDVRQVRGGEVVTWDLSTGTAAVERYWDVPAARAAGGSAENRASAFGALLEDAVQRRLVSDVPVGTCLSGGIDSSTVVCMIERLLRAGRAAPAVGRAQRTFSARYRNGPHDEGRFIDAVVEHTAVDSHVTYPADEDIAEQLAMLVYHQDEPFGTLSIFAQWCVYKLARSSGVTVTLDGQGADEPLAGYHTAFLPRFASLARQGRIRDLARQIDAAARAHGGRRAAWMIGTPLYLAAHDPAIPARLGRSVRRAGAARGRGRESLPHWLNADLPRGGGDRGAAEPWFRGDPFEDYLYRLTVRPGLHHLLRFADRNAMAFSVEARLPFLDHRLVELAFEMPPSAKLHLGVTKVVLREATRGLLPEAVRLRKDKIGFSVPQAEWLRGPLRGVARDACGSPEFGSRPYWDAAAVRHLLDQHLRGAGDYSRELWRVLSVEMWFRRCIEG